MKSHSWFSKPSRGPQVLAVHRSARPVLERLEDRCVPSTIQGTILDTGTNAGLAGWTVWLDLKKDRVLDAGDPVTTSDANGHYFFDTTNVPPAIVTPTLSEDVVQFDLQVGTGGRWLNTTQTDAVVNRTTTPDATADFGVSFQPTVGVAPVGPESPVNLNPTGAPQGYPLSALNVPVAADALGNYAVAWRNYTTGTIYARVFNADGSARTGEIAVGVGTGNPFVPDLLEPKVAMAGNGRFAVAWDSINGSQNASSFVRVFDMNGTPAAGPVTLVTASSTTSGAVTGAAADAQGNFVVLYDYATVSKGGKSTSTLKAQRFTASGGTNGSAISVASASQDGNSGVGMDGAGNFVVVWDGAGVLAQRYTAAGSKVGSQIIVTSIVTSGGSQSSVAMNSNGGFVVAYLIAGQRQAQIYNANGTPAGAAVTFTSDGSNGQRAAVALDGAGNVTFAWASGGASNNLFRSQVRIRQLPAGGVLRPETLANTTTQGARQLPGVAATGSGTFVVVWEGYGAADPAGIYGQRFAPLATAAGGAAPATTRAPALTRQSLQPLVNAAIARWARAGASAAQLAALRAEDVQIADLAGAELGQAAGKAIRIDRDAAGYGWFVDPTPNGDSEFRTPGDHGQRGHMDLLTVLCHEMGHVLGLGHSPVAGDVMAETLNTGVRDMPAPGDVPGFGAVDAALVDLAWGSGERWWRLA